MSLTIGSRLPQPPTGMPGAIEGVRVTKPGRFGGGPSVIVDESPALTPLRGAEQVDAAVMNDLRRNDELGGLFDKAFNLSAPAMLEGLKG